MTHHIDISWEEKRFWASALILAGMAANYHHNLIPSDYWATGAVSLADHLLQVLSNSSGGGLFVLIIIKEMGKGSNTTLSGSFTN